MEKGDRVTWEWVLEEVETHEDGERDVVETLAYDSLDELSRFHPDWIELIRTDRFDLALRRDLWKWHGDLEHRAYGYVDGDTMQLPDKLEDCDIEFPRAKHDELHGWLAAFGVND